jgi:broad specificity phosphatase PhoE
MKPKNIILVRHGESQGNANKEIYKEVPDYALLLTSKGKEQAIQAGMDIRNLCGNESVKFYVSPFWRTRQTLQGILKSFPTIKFEDAYEDLRLREQEWCNKLPINGYRHDMEEERDSFGHCYYRFEGGESCADVYDRVSDFFNTLNRDFEKSNFPENCVIVGHGMTNRVFLARWLHATVEEFESWGNPKNCELKILSLQPDGKYKLVTPMRKHELRHNYQFKQEWFDER